MKETSPVKPKPRRVERTNSGEQERRIERSPSRVASRRGATVIGWQGIRFRLPADWNLTGFSMNREDGYLRVDAPGDEMLTVQVRWLDASRPEPSVSPTLFSLASTYMMAKFRRSSLLRKAQSGQNKNRPDLRANLDRILRETEKAAKKAKTKFESTVKEERVEGPKGERIVLPFSWVGEGRGQGKIWHCATCGRIVVAQVIGVGRDHSTIANVANQLFSSLHDHADAGYDLWALYDLEIELPEDFHLISQKLLSGHLHLEWGRSGEKVILDRWGLANMTLKKFTPAEWFTLQSRVGTRKMQHDAERTIHGHQLDHYAGNLPLLARARILKEASGGLKRFPTRYEAGIWNCPATNKLVALQVLCQKKTVGLWREIAERYRCHAKVEAPDEPETDDCTRGPQGQKASGA